MSLDFRKISQSKDAHRRKRAALPIAEKLRLLDAMRKRAVAIRGSQMKRAAEDPVAALRRYLVRRAKT